MRILQTPATLRNALILPYKEEIAGSIGRRPLRKSGVLQKNVAYKKGLQNSQGPFVQQLCSNAGLLRESCLHSSDGLVSHARQEVRVGVESHGYGSMPHKLLDELRVGDL
jgi:hypothetical protein